MTEVELTVRADEVRVGDYLHVGHQWWGQVYAVHKAFDQCMWTVGGCDYRLMCPREAEIVKVRRDSAAESAG